MSSIDKNGIFLFGVVACVATAFRWRAGRAAEDVAPVLTGQNDTSSLNNDTESDVDSLDDYFDDNIDYDVRDDFSEADGHFKMVLVVNMKLGMGKGKIAAQCGHATLGAYELSKRYCRSALKCWFAMGTAKIALKAVDDEALLEMQRRAVAAGLVCCLVHDAGHTQIAAGSRTVLAIGPAPYELCDTITGKLKLL
jgi:peptidyl-tRNA hydrolase, PTH2 family